MKLVYSIPNTIEDNFPFRALQYGYEAVRVEDSSNFDHHIDADLFIDGTFSGTFYGMEKPLLIHAPGITWRKFENAPANSARICAWPGFWEREVWEIVSKPDSTLHWVIFLQQFGIQVKQVPDIPGMVAPRILATLINEAIFAVGDGIASASDIDTAMRLGTNYPLGPIEWGKAIGALEVYNVLTSMEKEDKRYAPHALLIQHLQ